MASKLFLLPLRSLRKVWARPTGRFLLALGVGGLVAWWFGRDELIRLFGFGLAPVGALVVAGGWFLMIRPLVLVKRWRIALAAILATSVALTVLGIFNSPHSTIFQDVSSGGWVGVRLARTPFSWRFGGPTAFDLGQAALRAAVLAFAASFVLAPIHVGRATGRSMRVVLIGADLFLRAARRTARIVRLWWSGNAESDMTASSEDDALAADESSSLSDPNGPDEMAVPNLAFERTSGREFAPPEEEIVEDFDADAGFPEIQQVETTVAAPGDRKRVSAPVQSIQGIVNYSWKVPPLSLLRPGQQGGVTKHEIQKTSKKIIESLAQHGIDASVDQVRPGPSVTMYGIAPGWGPNNRSSRSPAQPQEGEYPSKRVRVDTILAREKDLALALASSNLRFEAPIPGASLVGIEVPNTNPYTVSLRSVIGSETFQTYAAKNPLPVPLGIASAGEIVCADLTKMTHVLVAGATGSGKSVCINSLITSLLMVRSPAELRLLLIDPCRGAARRRGSR